MFCTRAHIHSRLIQFKANCKAEIRIHLDDIQYKAEHISLKSNESHLDDVMKSALCHF